MRGRVRIETVVAACSIAAACGGSQNVRPILDLSNAPFDIVVSDVTGPCDFSVSPIANGQLTIDSHGTNTTFHFGGKDFVGTIDASDHFVVTLVQQFTYADGCRWQSTDTISETFPTSTTFDARTNYDETVLQGTVCAQACYVQSHLTGQRRS